MRAIRKIFLFAAISAVFCSSGFSQKTWEATGVVTTRCCLLPIPIVCDAATLPVQLCGLGLLALSGWKR